MPERGKLSKNALDNTYTSVVDAAADHDVLHFAGGTVASEANAAGTHYVTAVVGGTTVKLLAVLPS